ncbi:MAG: hypothetical protein KGZ63_05850 [Clostridiales bacterium]|jgi:ethanolamine utilization microcompartment shell protein EutL|nr:hypothetical protein [Clostridiales bacterium]
MAELRAYVYIDRMQAQYAAYVGTVIRGDTPVEGMAELYIEIAPGIEIFRTIDVALKAAEVRPASLVIEREFGMMEIHGWEQSAVLTAGQAVLQYLGLQESDRLKPNVVSAQIISNIDPYQAQLINRFKNGSMMLGGQALYILEVFPAAYAVLAANEAEKAVGINIVDIRNVGRFGRLFISGTEAEVLAAKEASIIAIESLTGAEGK